MVRVLHRWHDYDTGNVMTWEGLGKENRTGKIYDDILCTEAFIS